MASRNAPPRGDREACDPELSPPQPLFERPVESASAEEELVHVRLAGARPAWQVRAAEYFRLVHIELPQRPCAPGNFHRGRYPKIHRGDETSRRFDWGNELLSGAISQDSDAEQEALAQDRGAGGGALGRGRSLPRGGACRAGNQLGAKRAGRAPTEREPLGSAG